MPEYFSVIIGDGCNARCPFCIAPDRMKNAQAFDVDGLIAAHRVAQSHDISTYSVSGGGEPLMLAIKDRPSWDAVMALTDHYNKSDLHSNYSIDISRHGIELFPHFTHVTVSLWPDAATNKAYMGYTRYDKTCELIRRDAHKANFRLSAILGTDWATGVDSLEAYCDMALELGVKSVTFRTFQRQDYEDLGWIEERYTDGVDLHNAFAAKYPQIRQSLRDLSVYDYNGLSVMFYRYAAELDQADEEFLFYRPSTDTGEYGLYTDYLDEQTHIPLTLPAAVS